MWGLYVTVKRHAKWHGRAGDLARRAQDGFVPELRRQPGFRVYRAFESEEDGAAVFISVLDDRDLAVRTNALVLQWVRAVAGDALPCAPEVASGPSAICETRQIESPQSRPLYATVRQHHGLGPEERVWPSVREHVLPLIARSPGFRAFFLHEQATPMNRQHPGQGFDVAFFGNRAEGGRANERAAAAMLQYGVAPYPPKVATGEVFVFAAAEAARADLMDDLVT